MSHIKSFSIEESYSNIPHSIAVLPTQVQNKDIRRDMLIRLSKEQERRYKESVGPAFPDIPIHSKTQHQTTTQATVECETVL